ncbi:MAG: hypothetical protein VYE40_18555 [Myxococcota bacterium]|jgi:hypothetical protein|nr:hypothetical protein [Myxococcota bacterium]
MSTCKLIAFTLLLALIAAPSIASAQAPSRAGNLTASTQPLPHTDGGPITKIETPTAGEQPGEDRWSALVEEFNAREKTILDTLSDARLPTSERVALLERLDLERLDFCQDFETMDSLGTTLFISTAVPTWKAIWYSSKENEQGNRPLFIPELITLVEHCNYSRGSLYRAAFLLEYMYWNRMIDRTGMEVADALKYRDHFYELEFLEIARDKIAWARGLDHRPPRTSGNFFEAPEMSLAFFLKLFGNVTTSFPPRRRRAYMAMIETINLRKGSQLMFGHDIATMLERPEDLELMSRYYAYLLKVEQQRKLQGVEHGGWHTLVKMAGGDRARAVRVITLLASLRGWVLEELSDALIAKNKLTPEMLRAFYSGANTYFIMHRINERSAKNGDDPYTLRYHFFHPPNFESTDWKAYHWYANAHLGCRLSQKGMDRRSATLATRRLAQAYEALTLNLAIPTKRAMGEEPRARAIIEGWEDVDMNAAGGNYGWKICN